MTLRALTPSTKATRAALAALIAVALALAGMLGACGGKIGDDGSPTSDVDASTTSLDGATSADGSSSSDAGAGTLDPPRVLWDASPEAAPSDLGYYPSTCIARGSDAPPPDSPYIGPGYARVPTTARTRQDLLAICTQDVYRRLMSEYCASVHDSRSVQWGVLMYYGQVWSACASFGCQDHGCP